nr:hypothetical protein [Oceanobacillus sp. CFH 90083]
MYKTFYSLAQTPFSKDIRPENAFLSIDYQGALGALHYLKERKEWGFS